MTTFTRTDEVRVPIRGHFDWDEFSNGLTEICRQMRTPTHYQISGRARTEWVCKINSSRIEDIQAWPPARKSWSPKLKILAGTELGMTCFQEHLTLIIDDQVIGDFSHWSFHCYRSRNDRQGRFINCHAGAKSMKRIKTKPSGTENSLFKLALLEKIERSLRLRRKMLFPDSTPFEKFRKKFWRLIALRDAKHLAERYAPNMLLEELTEATARSWPERLFSQLPKRVRKAYGF